MAYTYNYSTTITALASDNVITTSNNYNLTAQLADYTITNVFLVAPNNEVDIALPGINRLLALNISSDQLFDVAISVDTEGAPVYSGVWGHSYARLIKSGAVFTTLKIKASTEEAVIKLTAVGLEAL